MKSVTFWFQRLSFVVAAVVSVGCSGGVGNNNSGGNSPSTYTVGGTLSGLAGSGLVLANNGGDNLALGANGGFAFATSLADSAAYSVSVVTQPTNPSQTCVVTGGTGAVASGNVSNVAVNCTTNTYAIGGTVSGLAGSGLVLRNNGGNDLAVNANGGFNFTTAVASGGAYSVTVAAPPTNLSQTCSVVNGGGTVGAGDVANIAVTCVTNTFTISGTVRYANGSGMVLQNNGGNNTPILANGAFSFSTAIADGSGYAVTVLVQPSAPAQTCSVTGGTSTVAGADVSNVLVTCDPWTKQRGTTAFDAAFGVAVDSSGSVYVAGETTAALDGNTHVGNEDVFIVKYEANGNRAWTRQLGTAAVEFVYGVAVDASGNVYVAGETTGAFGAANQGSSDIFLVKYDTNGNWQWTRQLGTADYDGAFGVATDASGNVYVAGETEGDLNGVNAGGSDLFVAKYNANGVLQWTRQLGTAAYDAAFGIATDASGDVYVAGETAGDIDGAGTDVHAGSGDLFAAKYNASGVLQWTRQRGTASYDAAFGVATDAAGNVYVGGGSEGAMGVGANAGGEDVVIVKYEANGTFGWVRQFGTASNDYTYAVAADNTGVYVTGETAGALDGVNAGGTDLFVAKYGASGNSLWARQLGTTTQDAGYGIAVGSTGDVYAAGKTMGSIDGYINAGGADLFAVKYSSGGVKQ